MQIYFEIDFITISYEKASHSSIAKWHLPPLSAEFREGMEALLLSMKHFKTGTVVADVTNFGPLHPDSQHWVQSDWMPRAKKVGYSHAGFILPEDIYKMN